MRVLLGAALVAGASANQTKWQAFYAADGTANKPDIPTTVTDAVNTTYDEAMQAFGTVVGEQMDKAADKRDYDKVVAAAATLETACGVYVASYGADSTWPEIGADAAAKLAAKTAAKTANANAYKLMADEYIGECKIGDTAFDVDPTLTKSVKEVCEEDADAATDGAQVGVFTPAATNAATSLVQANAAFDQADDVVCSFAPDSANLNNFLYFSGSADLTADEKKGITDAIAKAKKAADDAKAAAEKETEKGSATTSADDASSKSPAYALAAGAAAVFALLL